MVDTLNRAFMYGESVFTTLRMSNGKLHDWDDHFDRLKEGTEYLYGPFTDNEDWITSFKSKLKTRITQETGDKVIRVTIYREQARGLIRTGLMSISDLKIHISASAYDPTRSEGRYVKLKTCPAVSRPHWWPSFLKAGSYLETILSQKLYLGPDDDDLLFLSPDETILESSVANIFVVRHNNLYTPPTGPNVLSGIMRKKVLDCASDFFDDVEESATSLEQIMKADAVFGTNSVRGPFLISRIDEREFEFDQEFLKKFESLREKVMGYGEF